MGGPWEEGREGNFGKRGHGSGIKYGGWGGKGWRGGRWNRKTGGEGTEEGETTSFAKVSAYGAVPRWQKTCLTMVRLAMSDLVTGWPVIWRPDSIFAQFVVGYPWSVRRHYNLDYTSTRPTDVNRPIDNTTSEQNIYSSISFRNKWLSWHKAVVIKV